MELAATVVTETQYEAVPEVAETTIVLPSAPVTSSTEVPVSVVSVVAEAVQEATDSKRLGLKVPRWTPAEDDQLKEVVERLK